MKILCAALLLLALPVTAQTGRTFTYDCIGQSKITLADSLKSYRVKKDTTRVSATPCFYVYSVPVVRDSVVIPKDSTPTIPPPTGWVLFRERTAVPTQSGWYISDNASTVTVANDPTGVPSLRMFFAAGSPSGSSPAGVGTEGFAYPRLRFEAVLSYPLNYVKHPTSVDKSIYVQVNAQNLVFTMMYDPTRLIPAVGLQGTTSFPDGINLTQNVGTVTAEILRGTRRTMSCEFIGNTAWQANGRVDCWLDTAKFLSRTGVQFTPGDAKFTGIQWAPIYGGEGVPLPVAQSVYLGSLKVFR